MTVAKQADLAGPGIGDYAELERVLPDDYEARLSPKETMQALFGAKRLIEDRLCEELNLTLVQVPLIVEAGTGSTTISTGTGRARRSRSTSQTTEARIRSMPKSSRPRRSGSEWRSRSLRCIPVRASSPTCGRSQGLLPRSRPLCLRQPVGSGARDHPCGPDARLPHRHRALDLEGRQGDARDISTTVSRRWRLRSDCPRSSHSSTLEILEAYPDLPRKQRETEILQEIPALFIYGIGWPLADGYPHELRAADYDDWSTETDLADGRPMHGLNGDILVWNPVTRRRHELSSMGVRVTKEGLRRQLELAGPARLSRAPVSPGDPSRRDPALDRRRNRSVPCDDAAAADRPPG